MAGARGKWLIHELTGRTVDFVMAEQSHKLV